MKNLQAKPVLQHLSSSSLLVEQLAKNKLNETINKEKWDDQRSI